MRWVYLPPVLARKRPVLFNDTICGINEESYFSARRSASFFSIPASSAQCLNVLFLPPDVDLAPKDVVSLLVPLLESRQLFVPGRGEVHMAATGFQLFATRRLVGKSAFRKRTDADLLGTMPFTSTSVGAITRESPSVQDSVLPLDDPF